MEPSVDSTQAANFEARDSGNYRIQSEEVKQMKVKNKIDSNSDKYAFVSRKVTKD